MSETAAKVGIISCSGEAIPEGTISRLATRRVLELLRPDVTVTLCLPLFLAGNEGERNFARTHPTITIDGCAKQCAKWGTEQHSGPVSRALTVSEILGTAGASCHRSCREMDESDKEAVWAVAERIAAEVDSVLSEASASAATVESVNAAQCSCASPVPGGTITIDGNTLKIAGLPLIFEQCAERGIEATEANGAALLAAVKLYHHIESEQDVEYRAALLHAYRSFRGGASREE